MTEERLEVWKAIEGFEGLYEVSNFGRVKSLAKEWKAGCGTIHTKDASIVSQHFVNSGYLKVALYKDGICKNRTVHRLVAIHFCENPGSKPHVNHKNGDKLDNRFDNLEWVSPSENQRHAVNTGLRKMWKKWEGRDYWRRGESHHRFGKTGNGAKKVICSKTGRVWDSIKQCSDELNIDRCTLIKKLKGKKPNNTSLKYLT